MTVATLCECIICKKPTEHIQNHMCINCYNEYLDMDNIDVKKIKIRKSKASMKDIS